MSSLRRHERSDLVKWVITFVLLIALVAAVAILGVKLNKQITTKTIGVSSYEVGALDVSGKKSSSKASLRTTDYIEVDGLKIELKDEATITYKVFFYDDEMQFISSTTAQTTDYISAVPENAKYFKIVITPNDDDEITLLEKSGYVRQLTVTVNK